ncbi:hypothetical protein JCM17961_25070 [Endothiovibrio diazotrophicus]
MGEARILAILEPRSNTMKLGHHPVDRQEPPPLANPPHGPIDSNRLDGSVERGHFADRPAETLKERASLTARRARRAL